MKSLIVKNNYLSQSSYFLTTHNSRYRNKFSDDRPSGPQTTRSWGDAGLGMKILIASVSSDLYICTFRDEDNLWIHEQSKTNATKI